MVNYVNYITFSNTFLDTWYDLGYDWDNYEFNMDYQYPDEITSESNLFRRSGGAIRIAVVNQNNKYYSRNDFSGISLTRPAGYNPIIVNESYTEENNQWKYDSNIAWQLGGSPSPYVDIKYGNKNNELRSWGRLIIGDSNNVDNYQIGEITLKVNGVLVMDLKPCISGGVQCFYDTVRERYFYPDGYIPSNSMIKTVVMTGSRQTLPIDDGIETDKISNRIIEVNKYVDGYAGMYNEIAISADEDNYEGVEISDYTIDKQINQGGVADFIELKPRGTLILPRNRQIAALNRPMVKGHKGDLLRIVVR